VAQLDQLGLDRPLRGKPLPCLVQRQEVFAELERSQVDLVEVLANHAAPVLAAALAACTLDQDAPHRLGSSGEETAATVPALFFIRADQPELRLMNQTGGFQRLPWFFLRQSLSGEPTQRVVYQGQQLPRGLWVGLLDGDQDLRDVWHPANVFRGRRGGAGAG
jgi:hypothetical protein